MSHVAEEVNLSNRCRRAAGKKRIVFALVQRQEQHRGYGQKGQAPRSCHKRRVMEHERLHEPRPLRRMDDRRCARTTQSKKSEVTTTKARVSLEQITHDCQACRQQLCIKDRQRIRVVLAMQEKVLEQHRPESVLVQLICNGLDSGAAGEGGAAGDQNDSAHLAGQVHDTVKCVRPGKGCQAVCDMKMTRGRLANANPARAGTF